MINLYKKKLTSHLIILIESHPSNHVSSIYPQNSNIKLFLRSLSLYKVIGNLFFLQKKAEVQS
jgi:hypothetical protein